MKIMVNGVERDATPEEEAAILVQQELDIIPAAPPVPAEISPSQLFEGLARAGLITSDEAIAAARTGEVPAKINALFATLPDDQAFAARIKWARMGTVERNHPLVAALAAANKLTSEEIDDAFRAWSAL